ncbi:MAG: hypothetical protein M3461_02460 [Pseudomonadota bacterium]|nr:hypothetical protein [Pseudomonadota bacterium]
MMTKTTNDCTTKGLCYYESLTRTRFFHGMLLTDDHLRAEQTYHREALKRVNRYLWGSGIVCGLEVKCTSGLCIKVHPGLALDCYGNVIEVCKCITLDLSEECKKAYPGACVPAYAKPICKYLVLRYVEIPADPEPVLTASDDCTPPGEGTKCEASKYREGFCLELRDKCPDCPPCPPCPDEEKERAEGLVATMWRLSKNQGDKYVTDQMHALKPDCMESPPCPDCHCDDGAVGLAKLEIDCENNTVEVKCECRQYIWSPRLLRWLICGLFGDIDKLTTDTTGLYESFPPADAIYANPMQAAWDIGTVALSARRIMHLQQELHNLNARVAAVEKAQAPKGKSKDQ